MGVGGAALATGLGGLASLFYFAVRLRGTIPLRAINPGKKLARRAIALGLAGTLSSALTALTVGVSFLFASEYGDALIAAVSVASKVYAISITLAAALAFSLQPFVGYNCAAAKRARMWHGIALSLGIGTAVCLLSAAAYLLFGNAFMRAFSDDPAITKAGARMMRYFAIGVPFASFEMTAIMYLSATGQAGRSIVAGLGRDLALFFPALFLLKALFGLDGLMLAYPATDIAAAVLGAGLCLVKTPRHSQIKLRNGAQTGVA
jgi:Na+-driven multidrug efflux pump